MVLAGAVRLCIAKKNKFANLALAGGTAWFAVKELSGPVIGLLQDNFGKMEAILGTFR